MHHEMSNYIKLVNLYSYLDHRQVGYRLLAGVLLLAHPLFSQKTPAFTVI